MDSETPTPLNYRTCASVKILTGIVPPTAGLCKPCLATCAIGEKESTDGGTDKLIDSTGRSGSAEQTDKRSGSKLGSKIGSFDSKGAKALPSIGEESRSGDSLPGSKGASAVRGRSLQSDQGRGAFGNINSKENSLQSDQVRGAFGNINSKESSLQSDQGRGAFGIINSKESNLQSDQGRGAFGIINSKENSLQSDQGRGAFGITNSKESGPQVGRVKSGSITQVGRAKSGSILKIGGVKAGNIAEIVTSAAKGFVRTASGREVAVSAWSGGEIQLKMGDSVLHTLREPLATYQEQRGLSKSENYSFFSLMNTLVNTSYEAIKTITNMLLHLFPLFEGFLYVCRFILDKLIEIIETPDTSRKVLRVVLFVGEMLVVGLALLLICGFVIIPIAIFLIALLGKLVGSVFATTVSV